MQEHRLSCFFRHICTLSRIEHQSAGEPLSVLLCALSPFHQNRSRFLFPLSQRQLVADAAPLRQVAAFSHCTSAASDTTAADKNGKHFQISLNDWELFLSICLLRKARTWRAKGEFTNHFHLKLLPILLNFFSRLIITQKNARSLNWRSN